MTQLWYIMNEAYLGLTLTGLKNLRRKMQINSLFKLIRHLYITHNTPRLPSKHFAYTLFLISPEYSSRVKRNLTQCLSKIFGGKQSVLWRMCKSRIIWFRPILATLYSNINFLHIQFWHFRQHLWARTGGWRSGKSVLTLQSENSTSNQNFFPK